MKKVLLSLIATTTLVSQISSACIGGDLIQVIADHGDGSKTVLANYEKKTGLLKFMNSEVAQMSVKYVASGADACAVLNKMTNSCDQLQQMKGADLEFQVIKTTGIGISTSKIIKNVRVIKTDGAAKEGPPSLNLDEDAGLQRDSEGMIISNCSTQ